MRRAARSKRARGKEWPGVISGALAPRHAFVKIHSRDFNWRDSGRRPLIAAFVTGASRTYRRAISVGPKSGPKKAARKLARSPRGKGAYAAERDGIGAAARRLATRLARPPICDLGISGAGATLYARRPGDLPRGGSRRFGRRGALVSQWLIAPGRCCGQARRRRALLLFSRPNRGN